MMTDVPSSPDIVDVLRRLDLPKKERRSLHARVNTIIALVHGAPADSQQLMIAALTGAGYDATGGGCGCAYGRYCGGEEYVCVRTRQITLVFDPADGTLVEADTTRRRSSGRSSR